MITLRETLTCQHQEGLAKIHTVEDLARYVADYESFGAVIMTGLLERVAVHANETGRTVDYDLVLWVLQNDDKLQFVPGNARCRLPDMHVDKDRVEF